MLITKLVLALTILSTLMGCAQMGVNDNNYKLLAQIGLLDNDKLLAQANRKQQQDEKIARERLAILRAQPVTAVPTHKYIITYYDLLTPLQRARLNLQLECLRHVSDPWLCQ